MRATVTLDDDLLAQAAEYSGVTERTALIHRALREMVQREAGRRLAAMGGTMPGAWAPNEGDEPPE